MKKVQLKVEGMTCSACSSGLEKFLLKQKGILSANVNLILGMVTIEYENLSIHDLENYISQAGFSSSSEYTYTEDSRIYSVKKRNLILFGFLLIFLMYVSMGSMISLPELFSYSLHPIGYAFLLLFVSVLFIIYGFDILKSGFLNLIHRMLNMDSLVLLSVFFCFFYSFYGFIQVCFGNSFFLHQLYFESVSMVIYFVKLGRFLENISRDKTSSTIKNLVTITPKNAIMKKGKEQVLVSLDEISVDDILLCRPNEKFAVDGEVVKGEGHVDESFLTGESVPVLKKRGSSVLAGSINYDGVLEYKAKKIGKDSTVSSIVRMVVDSLSKKNKIERLADKISSYFVPFIFLVAVFTLIIKLFLGFSFISSFHSFVTVLVIACPCALGLAVPLVVVVSNGLCANKGLYLRSGDVLEKARNIDTVVFDKTGTLTVGKLQVFKLYNYSKYKDSKLLDIVSSIEAKSTHPINTAFKKRSKLKEICKVDFAYLAFHGGEGEGGGVQGYLDLCNIPYSSPCILGSSISLDKEVTKLLLKSNGIDYAKYVVLTCLDKENTDDIKKKINKLSFPLIVKPNSLGSSIGVTYCDSLQKALNGIDFAFLFDDKVIVEEVVENLREFNIAVVGNNCDYEVSDIEEVKSKEKFLTFENKYLENDKNGVKEDRIIPAIISKKIEERIKNYALKVCKLFSLKGCVRIDFLVDDREEKVYVNEVNTIPGSFASYLWKSKNYNFTRLLEKVKHYALIEYKMKKSKIVNFSSSVLKKFKDGKKLNFTK